MNRHIITNAERGHRAPLSKDEPTAQYSIKLPLSLSQFLREIGTIGVRKELGRYKKRIVRQRQQRAKKE